MGIIKHKTSLVISSDNLEPSEITDILDKSPTESHKRGDPVKDIPKTNNDETPRYEKGIWIFSVGYRQSDNIDSSILTLLSNLSDNLKGWEKIEKRHSSKISIGVFLRKLNSDFKISSRVLSKIHKRHLNIYFDMYGPMNDSRAK